MEAEQVIQACVRFGVHEDDGLEVLRAFVTAKGAGRDMLAEHDQDAESLVRKHLASLMSG